MKRILYTDYSSGFGGSSTVLYDFLKNLDRRKYQPIVVVARDGVNFDRTRALGIEVIKARLKVIGTVPYPGLSTMLSMIIDLVLYLIPNVIRLCIIIRRKRIDLVHINNNIKHCIDIILAAKIMKKPCICHIRETRPICKMDRMFGRFVQQAIVLNRTVFKDMDRLLGGAKTRMIHDGIDLNVTVDPANTVKVRKEFNARGFYCIGFLGRLVKPKGVDVLIKAVEIVKKRYPRIRVLIVGDDPDQDQKYCRYLKELVDEMDLQNEVIFTGWRPDKFDLISIMDVVMQTSSVAEGFGLTCIEAMALGKPVIATNVTGPSSIIEHEKTGILVEPDRPHLMAQAIIRFIQNPALAERIAQEGRKNVEQRFDIKGNAREIESIYQHFLMAENK